jgi:hypothetical protein
MARMLIYTYISGRQTVVRESLMGTQNLPKMRNWEFLVCQYVWCIFRQWSSIHLYHSYVLFIVRSGYFTLRGDGKMERAKGEQDALCDIASPPSCVFVTINEARRYLATSIQMNQLTFFWTRICFVKCHVTIELHGDLKAHLSESFCKRV